MLRNLATRALHALRVGLVSIAIFQFAVGASFAQNPPLQTPSDGGTSSPIKHVIVIIGENRSFDHVFATYVPKSGDGVWNLLSQGIVNANGTPGPNFSKAQQFAATDTDVFQLSPPKQQFPNRVLPAPLVGGPSGADGFFSGSNPCNSPAGTSPLNAVQCAQVSENGLPNATYYQDLASGGTGLTTATPDTRISSAETLPPGPFQLTNSNGFSYNDYAASPVHRFYQMWQQEDCSLAHATRDNPSGCNHRLFSWVETTVGAGTNGVTQPTLCSTDGDVAPCFTTNYLPNNPKATTTGEGSTSLGFYNVQQGDVPYFKSLADTYAMSDNFHQSVDGGTGANHIMFGHGDMISFYDPNSQTPNVPPENELVFTQPFQNGPNPNQGTVNEIENPNPAPGTNNWYTEDGYGAGAFGSPSSGGGSYSDCSDRKQAGVGPIVEYLTSIHVDPHCQPGHYYLLNNYNPGYFGNGKDAYIDQNPANTPFTVPPSSLPSIGDDLNAHNVSWKYYGDQWNNYVPDPYQLNFGTNGPNADEYCTICNPFQYDTSIMSHPDQVAAHIQDTANLYSDIANGTLPAVSIVKPSGYVDGHPSSSKLDLFEGFSEKIVAAVQANPALWKDTAIFITEDEGGGYYDSGYVQPLDFFGDGTRIIFLVVSPYATGGHISHSYTDHVSILKFIERNWGLPPVTDRSRDNLPDPIARPENPYVPVNGPAIGDLFDMFDFGHGQGNGQGQGNGFGQGNFGNLR
jgi:phospholipase C